MAALFNASLGQVPTTQRVKFFSAAPKLANATNNSAQLPASHEDPTWKSAWSLVLEQIHQNMRYLEAGLYENNNVQSPPPQIHSTARIYRPLGLSAGRHDLSGSRFRHQSAPVGDPWPPSLQARTAVTETTVPAGVDLEDVAPRFLLHPSPPPPPQEQPQEVAIEQALAAPVPAKPATKRKRQPDVDEEDIIDEAPPAKRTATKAPGSPPVATSSTPQSKHAPKTKGSAWTEEEEQLCIALMNSLLQPGQHKVEHLWPQIEQQMRSAGFGRTGSSIKNYWNRHLRAKSGLDERKTPRADTMTTGTLGGPKVGRLPGKKKQQEAIDLTEE